MPRSESLAGPDRTLPETSIAHCDEQEVAGGTSIMRRRLGAGAARFRGRAAARRSDVADPGHGDEVSGQRAGRRSIQPTIEPRARARLPPPAVIDAGAGAVERKRGPFRGRHYRCDEAVTDGRSPSRRPVPSMPASGVARLPASATVAARHGDRFDLPSATTWALRRSSTNQKSSRSERKDERPRAPSIARPCCRGDALASARSRRRCRGQTLLPRSAARRGRRRPSSASCVPRSTTLPRSMTTISSQSRIVLSRCATIRHVQPRRRRCSSISRSVIGSSALVASSRIEHARVGRPARGRSRAAGAGRR